MRRKTCLWKQILMIVYACMCEQMLDCEYVIALRLCVGATFSHRSLAILSNVGVKFKPLSEITVHPFDSLRVGCLRRVRWVCITLCLCLLWSVASEEGDGTAKICRGENIFAQKGETLAWFLKRKKVKKS